MAIQSVHRALKILNLFSYGKSRIGISEISRSLGLHKGTVQSLVRTLAEDGFLDQDHETQKYQLGLQIYELGVIQKDNLGINKSALVPAQELARKTGKLVRIGVWHEDSVLITLNAYPETRRNFREFGVRLPAYCTAMGKVFLAFSGKEELDAYLEKTELIPYTGHTIVHKEKFLKELLETRKKGHSINQEEHMLFRKAIGAPIYGPDGQLVASLGLVMDPDQSDDVEEKASVWVRDVLITAYRISQSMGYFNEPLPAVMR